MGAETNIAQLVETVLLDSRELMAIMADDAEAAAVSSNRHHDVAAMVDEENTTTATESAQQRGMDGVDEQI